MTLRCFSAMLPEVRPDINFTIQICDPFSTLRFTRGVGYTGWAAVCFAVLSHVRSQPVCVGEVMAGASFRYSHAIFPGVVLLWSGQLALKSVFHILHCFFMVGALFFFCLPEVVVTSLMIRRVIRILCSKC